MGDYGEAQGAWPDGGRAFARPAAEFVGTAAGRPQIASIAVVVALVGAFLLDPDVGGLLGRQLGELHADLL